MIGQGHIIEWDLYDIARRLKEIDDGYFVFYSYKTKKFEIHNAKQRGSTLALVLPYDRLDARALMCVKSTRRERASELFAQIERENELARRREVDKTVKTASKEMERALSKLK
ncbi:MAG: hypothetical protein IJY70_01230 [Clostridia bacterium]|nr:hypothetical protein [Clostridia bacterium]